MFYALTKAAELVSARDASKDRTYYCPQCHQRVILKCGRYNAPHFAHASRACGIYSEGETAEHLRGKKLLARFFKASGAKVRFEAYLSGLAQRPDLLIQFQDHSYLALEYQCAPLELRRLRQRVQGYRKVDLPQLWILGPHYRLKHSLPQQVAQFMRCSKNCGFYLIYLDSKRVCFEVIYAIQKADFLPLKYRSWRTDDVDKLRNFLATPQKCDLWSLDFYERRRQMQAIAKQIYYSTGAMRKLQELSYRKHLSLATVIKDCLAPTYGHPLYRTATLWVRAELYCLARTKLKGCCYESVFVDLRPFVQYDLRKFWKGLAFRSKNS